MARNRRREKGIYSQLFNRGQHGSDTAPCTQTGQSESSTGPGGGVCCLRLPCFCLPPTSVDTITQWREDWSSASVVDRTIVTDPTIRQPGFHLPRHTWSLMNRFRTGQGPCRANLHNYGVSPMQSPSCDCGQRQTMNHIVNTRPLTKFEGGLNPLHEEMMGFLDAVT